MENSEVLLRMENINMTFPGVKALQNVEFTLNKGEIHALMGENGAGKSTLIKVLNGVHTRDSGDIYLEGKPINNHSPQEAQVNGISTVFQEVNLCPNITVAENIFVGCQPKKGPFIDWKKMNKTAKEVLAKVGLTNIDVTKPLGDYSVAIQQMVAIARAVNFDCKVLILDEPTSSLDDKEVEELFTVMRRLRDQGTGIIFVTHFLEQVYAICDKITVLRDGQFEGLFTVDELPRLKLVQTMLGHEVAGLDSLHSNNDVEERDDVPVILKAVGLTHKGTIKPFELTIKKGEVVGLTGLLGSGRSELVRTLYGADKADGGNLTFKNKTLKQKAPIDSIKEGMAYLPEDRKAESIIADLSVRENMMIALQAKTGVFKLLPMSKQIELTEKYIQALNIKTASMETPIKALSGGNQQKVILGRWLVTNPEFLILDEPTRGIDVGTKTEIQKLVIKLASEGMTVMFISSEIEEMLRTVNKLCVLRDGQKVGELQNKELTQQDVMAAIAGGK
ncbi:MAG: sugar ABC transporter ATP-binding protein [Treponema sp.]|nr:sugar ABC transporter ATP-binding protein [Spirochaetia bacterium]MDY2838939.1 sugar ABC transporter ATP-binding protein [Treponema sp.]